MPQAHKPRPPVHRTPRACSGYRELLTALLSLLCLVAWAAGAKVLSASTYLDNDVYRLKAQIAFKLNSTHQEALQNGVPLTFHWDMEVIHRRPWMWDHTVARLKQRFRLEYNALTRQYVVVNLNSGELRSFFNQANAVEFLGQVQDFPLLDASLLVKGERYFARLRARLDIEALPTPLRLVAYLSGQWQLEGEWYLWPLL